MSEVTKLSGHHKESFDTSNIEKIKHVVDCFRTLDSEMQAQTMTVFLIVVESHPTPVPMPEIARAAGLAQSSTSRNIAALGTYHRKGQPGLKLLDSYEDPMDRRTKLVKLTPRGERFATILMKGE